MYKLCLCLIMFNLIFFQSLPRHPSNMRSSVMMYMQTHFLQPDCHGFQLFNQGAAWSTLPTISFGNQAQKKNADRCNCNDCLLLQSHTICLKGIYA
jgi:hypothetical protein